MVRYQDWTGERKQKCKRGFATKREAQEWERSFQMQTSGDLDMTFEAFTELYTKDVKPRLKENTWLTKENIIQKKILPYFGKRKISEITTKDVIAWQNELLAYRDEKRKPYSATYLKTLPCSFIQHPVYGNLRVMFIRTEAVIDRIICIFRLRDLFSPAFKQIPGKDPCCCKQHTCSHDNGNYDLALLTHACPSFPEQQSQKDLNRYSDRQIYPLPSAGLPP